MSDVRYWRDVTFPARYRPDTDDWPRGNSLSKMVHKISDFRDF